MGFWFFFRFVIIALHKKYPAISEAAKRVSLQIIIVILTAPILKGVLEIISIGVLRFCSVTDHDNPDFLQSLLSIYLPAGLIIALYEAFYYFSKYKESLVEREKLENMHIQNQLDNLRNQINPHFLFNSLNTLMNLIPTDPNSAMDYLSKLSKFYRYSVGSNEDKIIPLSKELECAELYAELLKVRFRNGIHFSFPTNYSSAHFILPMSLQLLIENSVKHNIVSKSQPLNIKITIDNENEYIEVINNIQKKMESVSSTGMGLRNIKERFAYFTDKEIKCEIINNEFRVSLPLLKV
jgi:sensor histidine kinase YesM